MGLFLTVLLIAVGYLFYVTRICKIEVESAASGVSIRVKNPILWQGYVNKVGKCEGGRLLIYPLKPNDTTPPVPAVLTKIVISTGDYPYKSVDQNKKVVFSWHTLVENEVAVGAISLKNGEKLEKDEIEKLGHKAVRQVVRSMLQPVVERIDGDEEQGTAWFNSLSRMGLEIKYD